MIEALRREESALEALVGQMAGEFSERLNRGERPAIEEYCERYPEAASVLREVLAALVAVGPPPQAEASVDGATEAPPLMGELGDFRIIREVGKGGMGVVYEAEQVSLRRRVALKVLPFAATMDPRHLRRFQNEAQAAACLHHTNIVPVYFVGCERGVHFYAMQFIDGQPLSALIQQLRQAEKTAPAAGEERTAAYRPSPNEAITGTPTVRAADDATPLTGEGKRGREYYRRVAELGVQAAEALDHAHQLGIVHRDVKPANLLLDGRGNLWVTDFGLAQVRHGETGLTMTGDLVGTLRYMSPEQALAKRVVIDHRTDVYSLGATLYELLTLRTVFDGQDRQELLRQIAFEEPTRPRRLARAIPAELEIIVLKAMEKRPQDRYATAQELADDLRHWLEDRPIRARRPTLLQRLRKWGRRHQAIVWSVAAVFAFALLSLAVCNVLIAAAYQEEATARHKAEEAEKQEASQRRTAERERDLAEHRLYLANLRRAQQAWEAGDSERVLDLLESHRPLADQRDRRGWEWYYLQAVCHAALFTLDESPSLGATRVVWSPDGRRLATIGNESATIHVRDAASGKIEATLRSPTGQVVYVDWNPDGKRLAACDSADERVTIWDVTTGSVQSTIPTQMGGIERVAWAPDGRRLAACNQRDAKVWEVASGKELFRAGPLGPGGREQRGAWWLGPGMAWSPKGDRLAISARNSNRQFAVQIWDTARWQQIAGLGKSIQAQIWNLAWSPDGRQLALGTSRPDSRVEVVDATTGKPAFPLPDALLTVAWSPDGRRLAGVSRTVFSAISLWDATNGKPLSTLRGHTQGNLYQVDWSPDGRQLASACQSGEIKVWDVFKEQEYLALRGHDQSVSALAWNFDMRHLASGSTDGMINIWDLTKEKPALSLKGSGNGLYALAWGPDGRQLAVGSSNAVHLWDTSIGKETLTLRAPRRRKGVVNAVFALAWSPDGRLLASINTDQTLTVWDTTTGQEVRRLEGDRAVPRALAWSPDGKRLAASGSGRLISVWETGTWQQLSPLPGHAAWVHSLAWSPDSRRLASASLDKTIRIWDADTGEAIRVLSGHAAEVLSVAWHSDRRRLASIGRDGTVRVWDLATGNELLTLHHHGRAVAWSPDGQRLVSAGADGTVRVWDASPGYRVPAPPPPSSRPTQRQGTAEIQTHLGNALARVAHYEEAEAAFRRALAVQDVLIAEYPDVPSYRERKLNTLSSFADCLEKSGQLIRAEQLYRDSLAVQEALTANFPGKRGDPWELHLRLGQFYQRTGNYAGAAGEYRRKVQMGSGWDIDQLNDVCWFFATCPDPRFRDSAKAVELAAFAVKSAPQRGEFWNTLGVAQYGAGDFKAAITSLNKSTQLRQGGDSFDWFFLAMAHRQLGKKEEARRWYDRAVQWMDKHDPSNEELRRFRAEAAALLKVEAAPDEKPQ